MSKSKAPKHIGYKKTDELIQKTLDEMGIALKGKIGVSEKQQEFIEQVALCCSEYGKKDQKAIAYIAAVVSCDLIYEDDGSVAIDTAKEFYLATKNRQQLSVKR